MIIAAKPEKQKPQVRVLFFPIKTHEREVIIILNGDYRQTNKQTERKANK